MLNGGGGGGGVEGRGQFRSAYKLGNVHVAVFQPCNTTAHEMIRKNDKPVKNETYIHILHLKISQ